jgi:hypothetical protein
LALLFTEVAGAQFINAGSANPGFYFYPHHPETLVYLMSPENHAAHNANNIDVNFTLDISTWALPMDGLLNPNYSFSSSVICYLDSHSVWEKTVNSAQKFAFSVPLTGLSEGLHTIEVNTTTNGKHYANEPKWSLYETPVLNSSGIVSFSVDTIAPRLSILFLENKTYYSPSVDLNFTVNDAASQVTYSLDGKENVPIADNTVLTGLTNGHHSLIVTATNEAGNTASQTIYFTIAEPFPFVTLIAVSVAVALVTTGFLIYHKKHKHNLVKEG